MSSHKTILCFVVRHGTTQLNSGGADGQPRFRGHVDVALDKQGVADANKLASLFSNCDISHIVSSDMQRATRTAKTIADRKGMEIHTTPQLRPWDVGEFSGQPKDKENRDALEFYVDHPRVEVPDGESLAEFKARVRPCIVEALKLADQSGEPALLVGHSSIIHEVGDMFHGDHQSLLVDPGGAIAIFAADGKISAEAIYKPREGSIGASRADTVS